MKEMKTSLSLPVDIVVEEERFEDGDGVEWNRTTTSDNPIDTGTSITTKPVMEKDVIEAIETSELTNDDYNKDLFVFVILDDTGRGGDRDKRPVITQF